MFTKKGDEAVLAKIADAPEQYREIGERLHHIVRKSAPSLEPIVRWGLPFYVKDGQDVCYIKIDEDFIAFGFGEAKNPTREEGAHMHPVAWTFTSLDDPTEEGSAPSSRRRRIEEQQVVRPGLSHFPNACRRMTPIPRARLVRGLARHSASDLPFRWSSFVQLTTLNRTVLISPQLAP